MQSMLKNPIIILIVILAAGVLIHQYLIFRRMQKLQKNWQRVASYSSATLSRVHCGIDWGWWYGFCMFRTEPSEMEKIQNSFSLIQCESYRDGEMNPDNPHECFAYKPSHYCSPLSQTGSSFFYVTQNFDREHKKQWDGLIYNQTTKQGCVDVWP